MPVVRLEQRKLSRVRVAKLLGNRPLARHRSGARTKPNRTEPAAAYISLRRAHGLLVRPFAARTDIVDEDSATTQHLGSRGGQERGEASRGWSQAAVLVPYRPDIAMRPGVAQGNFDECWVVMWRAR